MSTTTDLTTLKINYLTQAQYDTAKSQGLINADELYLTPAADSGINDVTVDGVSVVTDSVAEITMPTVPTKVSDLTNDAGYITDYTETDPTVPSWAKASSKPSYTAAEVGAVPTTRKVNGKALSSDITLSASDVSALPSSTVIPTVNDATLTIQQNGSTVQTFTANASSNKTANITVPTKVSDLTNDSGYITGYTETDPAFLASAAHSITSTDISNWNNKSDFSGSYTDLTDTPTIPSALSDLTNDLDVSDFPNDAGYLTSFTETDPIFTASAAHGITSSDITNWNGKQNALVSGTNIKTINNESLLGSGDIALPSPADYVVEQGTSGIWRYRKWESGIVECSGTAELASKAVTSAFGSGYYASMDTIALPTGLFTAIDCVHTTLKDGNGNGSWFNLRAWDNTSIVGYIYSLKSHTATFKVSISVVGRWK